MIQTFRANQQKTETNSTEIRDRNRQNQYLSQVFH